MDEKLLNIAANRYDICQSFKAGFKTSFTNVILCNLTLYLLVTDTQIYVTLQSSSIADIVAKYNAIL